MPRARCRFLAEIAVAGHRVEQLIVDQRDQKAGQLAAKRRQLLALRLPQRGQLEALRHRGLDRLDTGDQRLAALADRPRARRVLLQLHQPRQLRLEGHAVPGDLAGDARQVAGRGRGGQARGRGHQGAALPRHREGGHDLGNAALVDPTLDVTDPLEGDPTDQAGDDGEGDGRANTEIELRGDAKAASQQAFGQLDHRRGASRSVSTG